MTEARFVLTRSRPRPAPPPVPAPAPPRSEGGCGRGAVRPEFTPVLVDGVEIDPEDIAREMQNHPGPDPDESWREAARALVVRRLLLAEAERRGLAPAAERLGEGLLETEEESLVRAVLEAAVQPAEPTPAERRRVYEGLKGRFVTPTLFEASHILIEPPSDDEAGWAAAEAQAREIIVQVANDRGAFVAAAARSACPTGVQGGSLGQVRRGELAAPVQAAIEALAEGQTGAEPVRSRFGWHVVRLDRRIEGRTLPFEVVEPRIRDMLEARAWSIAAAQYVAELAAGAAIEGVALAPPETGFAACEEGRGC